MTNAGARLCAPTDMDTSNLPELPRGWVWTRLGEICEEVEKTYPKINPNDEFLYLDIASIDNQQQKIIQPKRYRGKDAPSRARQVVHSGDILFSTVRTYLKNIAMVNEAYDGQIASTGFCVIRASNGVNNRFIFSLTQTDEFLNPLTQLQRGTSYPAVRDSDVLAQFVPLPPLREQQRIVAKIEELFTKLDAGVAALQKVKAQLKRYRQAVLKHAFEGKLTAAWREAHKGELEPASVLLERIRAERAKTATVGAHSCAPSTRASRAKAPRPYTVDTSSLPRLPDGWVWTKLEEIGKIAAGGTPSTKNADNFGGEIPWLTPADLSDFKGKYIERGKRNLTQKGLAGSSAVLLPAGTVLFSSRAPIGYVAIASNSISTNQGFKNLIPFDGVFNEFVFYYLKSSKELAESYASGTTFLEISATKFAQLPIPLPPLAEQHKIVEEIERRFSIADEVEKVVEQSLKQAERLRQSILKRAFEGKLVPQDPNDEPAEKLLERIKQARIQNVGAHSRAPQRIAVWQMNNQP